jgi:NTP pyrophosphatase (non-canonical NTP hydrolase)
VSIYTPTEPFHLSVEQVPAVIADLRRLAAAATGRTADDAEPTAPAVGQRYTSRTDPARIVTVTRVWTDDGGRTAVAFDWRDDKPGQRGSALPLGVFLGTYKPAESTVTVTADPWPTIARLSAWLDNQNGRTSTETSLRILKVTEEAGEVASAWIGTLGQNPRKGVTHTAGDVADELCDVITAAMVALATIKQDPAAHFARKVAQIAALRLDTTGGES